MFISYKALHSLHLCTDAGCSAQELQAMSDTEKEQLLVSLEIYLVTYYDTIQ